MSAPTNVFNIGPFGWPLDVIPSADLKPAEWLQDPMRWKSWGAGEMALPGRVIPLGYSHYLRINHPAWKSVTGPGTPWYEAEAVDRRVPWKEVAAWADQSLDDITFFTDIVPNTSVIPVSAPFDGPPVGLSPQLIHLLTPVLAELTTTPDSTWISFWDGGFWENTSIPDTMDDRARPDYSWRQQQRQLLLRNIKSVPQWSPPGWAAGGRTYWMAQGPVGAVYDVARGIYRVEPNFWWPDDHAWCLSTEIDFDFTLIGTNEDGAKKLLAIPTLEIYPIEAE